MPRLPTCRPTAIARAVGRSRGRSGVVGNARAAGARRLNGRRERDGTSPTQRAGLTVVLPDPDARRSSSPIYARHAAHPSRARRLGSVGSSISASVESGSGSSRSLGSERLLLRREAAAQTMGRCGRLTRSRLTWLGSPSEPTVLWRFTPRFWEVDRQSPHSSSEKRRLRYDLNTTNYLLAGFARRPLAEAADAGQPLLPSAGGLKEKSGRRHLTPSP